MRKALKIITVLLLCFLIITGLVIKKKYDYLRSEETKTITGLAFLKGGTISFGATHLSLFKHFPNISITSENVEIKMDTLTTSMPLLFAEEVVADLTVLKLYKPKFELKALSLANGAINIQETSLEAVENLNLMTNNPLLDTLKTASNTPKKKQPTVQVQVNHLQTTLRNMNVWVTNPAKNTTIAGQISLLESNLDLAKEDTTLQLNLDLEIDQLALNEKEDAFLTNTRLRGQPTIHWQAGRLRLDTFALSINEETLICGALIDPSKQDLSEISIQIPQTHYAQIIAWLPATLQKELQHYQIQEAFDAKIKFQSRFQPHEVPLIEVDFDLKDKAVTIFGQQLYNTSMKGTFKNQPTQAITAQKGQFSLNLTELLTIYQQFQIETNQVIIDKKTGEKARIKTAVNVKGAVQQLNKWLKTDEFIFQKGHFKFTIDQLDNFLTSFNKKGLPDLLRQTNTHLLLKDFQIHFKPANIDLPFEKLVVQQTGKNLHLNIETSPITNGHPLFIEGDLSDFLPLLTKNAPANHGTISTIKINSKKLAWPDLFHLFTPKNVKLAAHSTATEKTYAAKWAALQQLLKSIRTNFQPSLALTIDTLQYNEQLHLHQFMTNLHFDRKDHLSFDAVRFLYNKGQVTADAILDYSQKASTPFTLNLTTNNFDVPHLLTELPDNQFAILRTLEKLPKRLDLKIEQTAILSNTTGQLIPNRSKGRLEFFARGYSKLKGALVYRPTKQIYTKNPDTFIANASIKLEGEHPLINAFLPSDKFKFTEGNFALNIEYDGAFNDKSQLIKAGILDFSMPKSAIDYIHPQGRLNLPFSNFRILSFKDDKTRIHLSIHPDPLAAPVRIKATAKQFSLFLDESTKNNPKLDLGINAKKLVWKEVMALFNPENDYVTLTAPAVAGEEQTAATFLKASLLDLLPTFDPDFNCKIDYFELSDKIAFNDFITRVSLDTMGVLTLLGANLNFYEGNMMVNGKVDLVKKGATPYEASILGNKLNLIKIVNALPDSVLQNRLDWSKITGSVDMRLDVAGEFQAKPSAFQLINPSTTGTLAIALNQLRLTDIKGIPQIPKFIRKRKRFRNIRFDPLVNTFSLQNQQLTIPRLELQSTALQLFVEGSINLGNHETTPTDLWVSVPLTNLLAKKRIAVPSKTGYGSTKPRVYVDIEKQDSMDTKVKFRLTRKQFGE